jgi:hypothetical protein
MPIQLGTTLRCCVRPRHIWIVLSDPGQHDGTFLFVNLTSVGGTCADTSCILTEADYSDLARETTVAYSRAHIGNSPALERAIQNGYFTELEPLPRPALEKVINGARSSPHLSAVKKALLPD